MRSAKRPKSYKKSAKLESTSRKKHKKKSTRSWSWNDDLSGLFIDDINEAIRKSRRLDGKGCWKLVPKDSCEVHKDRKKRLATRKRPDLSSEEISNDTESSMEEDKKENKKKLRKNYPNKLMQTKESQSKYKCKKRSKSFSLSACSSNLTGCTNSSQFHNC